jgi:hypothetical protein
MTGQWDSTSTIYTQTSKEPMAQQGNSLGNILYHILQVVGMPTELVRLMEMCIGIHLTDTFLIQNDLKEGDFIAEASQLSLRKFHWGI